MLRQKLFDCARLARTIPKQQYINTIRFPLCNTTTATTTTTTTNFLKTRALSTRTSNSTTTITTNRFLLYRAPETTTNFTTSPYNDAMSKVKSNAKMVFKITFYTTISVTCAVGVIWQMAHVYIEHFFESTPSEFGYQARNLLHGAYIREHIAPDYELAAVYCREALRIAIEEKKLPEDSQSIIDLRVRLAQNEARAGNVLDAITEYTRAWKMMQHNPQENTGVAEIAKKIGDLYIKIGEFEQAEEFLAWSLYKQPKDIKTHLSLASLYAMQRNFKLCLPLLTNALKNVSEEENGACLKAILQNQLSEVMYGMGKTDESMGWAQAALESCSEGLKKNKNDQDCLECGGVASNNLGSILEKKGDLKQSLEYFKQAVAYGSNIHDSTSQDRYIVNMERLENALLHNKPSSE